MGFFRNFFSTTARPGRFVRVVLSLFLFTVLIGAYLGGSYVRHKENPQDKIMPTVPKLVEGFKKTAFEKDRKGDLRLWIDTWASTKRFGISIGIIFLAVILGVNMGAFAYVEALFYHFILFFDKIPALALLPILFIVFGLGEMSKIALIVIGVFPTIALDAYFRTREIPQQQIHKGHTLGASEFEIVYRIMLPQVFPKILDTIRLNFKSAMLLLIAGESLAASVGLGYRIFVVRRYLAMDIIIPYVIWMTLLLFIVDWLVQQWIKRYKWLNQEA